MPPLRRRAEASKLKAWKRRKKLEAKGIFHERLRAETADFIKRAGLKEHLKWLVKEMPPGMELVSYGKTLDMNIKHHLIGSLDISPIKKIMAKKLADMDTDIGGMLALASSGKPLAAKEMAGRAIRIESLGLKLLRQAKQRRPAPNPAYAIEAEKNILSNIEFWKKNANNPSKVLISPHYFADLLVILDAELARVLGESQWRVYNAGLQEAHKHLSKIAEDELAGFISGRQHGKPPNRNETKH